MPRNPSIPRLGRVRQRPTASKSRPRKSRKLEKYASSSPIPQVDKAEDSHDESIASTSADSYRSDISEKYRNRDSGSASPPLPASAPGLASPHSRYRPMKTIDWRAEICRLLDISSEILNEDLFQAMEEASEKLREVDRLRSTAIEQYGPPRAQVIHTVRCHSPRAEEKRYLEPPWVVETGPYNAHLRGSQSINNFELYLERNKEVSFIVYKEYECCNGASGAYRQGKYQKDFEVDATAFLRGERIALIAPELKTALSEVASHSLEGMPHPVFVSTDDEDEDEILYPYIWYFHRRNEIHRAIDELPSPSCRYADCFRGYIQDRMTEEWETVLGLLGENRITAEYIDYLFVPDQIIVSQHNGSSLARLEAFVAMKWLQTTVPRNDLSRIKFSGSVTAYSWTFNGRFRKSIQNLSLGDLPSYSKSFSIFELPIYPLPFASETVINALRDRGEMFWRCRVRNYVSYNTEANGGIYNSADARYMVDIATYNQMHHIDTSEGRVRFNLSKDTESDLQVLAPEYMSQDHPELGDDFCMCLPSSIPGFNMQKKEWVILDVHQMRTVVWNTAAFDFLVIDPETKELIRAVLSNKLRAAENTDLIAGKGNGLFILLHGGPGTGKTLTAESVAEIAERPLYRVTCGDIGTKAEEVEKYLEAVLALGKTWGCVVLLDEADVFLEQRSLINLERNALVSVFLRVLEYYDGILILTSNRVGIFDEAFKSRIQLNLRYNSLDLGQRREIWKNFLERLKQLERERLSGDAQVPRAPAFGVDVKEIEDRIDLLAETELNGREIRNAISTARELAMYQKKPMGYKHLRAVINEAEKFEKYLYDLHGCFTPDALQRDKRER